jgi:hypothetical protein
MSKEVTFQFLWANAVRAMTYGTRRIIPLAIAELAWPATGQNEVVQLALVIGGHPPQPIRTTVEHIRHTFADDPSFVISQPHPVADIHIERLLESCPYCRGSGVAVVDDYGCIPLSQLIVSGWAPAAGHTRQTCPHQPAASREFCEAPGLTETWRRAGRQPA